MKVPKFLAFEPKAFDINELTIPTTDHHSRGPPSSSFSAYNTALTTLRWRKSPSDPDKVQSNARILRWSDGSLTLQFASDPLTQYEMTPNPLAPPQANPPKPTPMTSVRAKTAKSKRGNNQGGDSYLYLAAQSGGFLRLTNHLTTALTVQTTAEDDDNALEQLQANLAAASTRKTDAEALKATEDIALRINREDPELIRKRAEVAEREKMRAQRRREAAEQRERERSSRVFGRSMGRSGGLTVGGLEDDVGGPMRHRMPRSNKPKQRRRGGMDSDEEDFGRRFTREDEYDEEDDFLAPSDEEEEIVDDDDDDILDDGDEEEDTRRHRSPKRSRPSQREAADDDDDDVVVGGGRSKRRRVIDEDDEDE
jgi:RNA polymerase-associated protein LEO1